MLVKESFRSPGLISYVGSRHSSGYKLVDRPRPWPSLPEEQRWPYLQAIKEESSLVIYHPMEGDPDFFFDFINLQSPRDVLRFANRYGYLGMAEEQNDAARAASLASLPGVEVSHGRRYADAEEVSEWLWRSERLKRCYSVLEMINKREVSRLRELVQWTKSGVSLSFEGGVYVPIASAHRNTKWFSRVSKNDVITPAKLFIVNETERHLLDGSFALRPGLDTLRNFGYSFTPRTLHKALWLRMAQIAAGERRIIECQYCCKPMDVTGNRSNKKNHPKCSGKERIRRFREKEISG